VFLCGVADGEGTAWHLFDKVLALVADAPTLKRRIAVRTGEFGKTPEELAAILRCTSAMKRHTASSARSSSTRHGRWAKS
jgi:hypothetical protein